LECDCPYKDMKFGKKEMPYVNGNG
jgi:hypothetical protein